MILRSLESNCNEPRLLNLSEGQDNMWVVVKINYGPFLGTLNNRCRTILGTPKGIIILTTTHVGKPHNVLQTQ